jgi:hypothetical protein
MSLFEFDDKHGFSKPRREAAMRWMRRWLLDRNDAPTEGNFRNFTDAELQCTRSGQVLADFKGVSAFQISMQYADRGREARAKFPELGLAERQQRLRSILAIAPHAANDDALVQMRVTDGTNPPILVLRDQPLSVKSDAARYAKDGRKVIELAVRGIGGPAKGPFGNDSKTAQLGLLLARPLLGQRVGDVLAVVSRVSEGKGTIDLVAEGAMGPVALHAAALDPRVGSVTIERGLVSWDNVVRTPLSVNQLGNVVPGVLQSYDLPELAATLAPRPLTLRGTVDAAQKAVSAADVESAYRVCRQAYERQGAARAFRVE